ncbi:hypothetical protein V494_08117 [Pseudogymnoascus sp. VKM F-4513 (FW-928)]|nr:hypothetical protein V494_08117 [Pseudogymnoascus sp. VKM F-4513 (FW-928)]
MSIWEIPEVLSDWVKITEQDGILSTENISTALFLTGESFLSSCHLPDVKPNTKIVGICGISDWNKENDPELPGNAAPNREGWYFADFYLFHHLLKEVASDQVWLTCVSPESAVEKYGQYAYGDFTPKKIKDRRIVLDKTKLCELNDVQTVASKDLLENVLETISKACIEAKTEERPLLILIFSGGPSPEYAIEMGGENAEEPRFLTKESFREAIQSRVPEAGLCLLATEYHTGAWAINPDVKVAPLESKGKYFESLAWPISGTINKRPCGSEFSHTVTNMLLRMNLEGYVTKDEYGNRNADFEEHEERLESLVQDILEKEESMDKSLFAGDDDWEIEHSERTGIHPSEFYKRWCLLKDSTPGYDELVATVKREGEIYLSNIPGVDFMHRDVHNRLRGTIEGTKTLNFIELEHLRRQIDNRIDIMKTATAYKNYWGITMENCEDFDVECEPNFLTPHWHGLNKVVETYNLFDHLCDQDPDHKYGKGVWYLVSCIYRQEWDDAQMKEKLQSLANYKVNCTSIFLLAREHIELTGIPGLKYPRPSEPIICSPRQQDRDFSDDQKTSALRKEAKQYFDSKLRSYDVASDNGLHGSLHSVLEGTKITYSGHLRRAVDHRVNQIMGTATLYRDFLDIDHPGCHEVEVETFRCDNNRHYEIESLIHTYPLFNLRYYGRPYYKAGEYLSQCIANQPWSKSRSETIAVLDSLVKYRGPITCPLYRWQGGVDPKYPHSGVPNIKGTSQIMENIIRLQLSRDGQIRLALWKIGQITNCKINSLPINACRRKHLPRSSAGEDATARSWKLLTEVD